MMDGEQNRPAFKSLLTPTKSDREVSYHFCRVDFLSLVCRENHQAEPVQGSLVLVSPCFLDGFHSHPGLVGGQ